MTAPYQLCSADRDDKVHIYRTSTCHTRCHEVGKDPHDGHPTQATCNACRYAAGLPAIRTRPTP